MANELTHDEWEAIRRFAMLGMEASASELVAARNAAIAAHRSALRRDKSLLYQEPHMAFMREVDTPAVDLYLRRRYREEVVAAGPWKAPDASPAKGREE